MKRRLPFLKVLVLGFYLFYALAPLLYYITDAQEEELSESLPGFSLAAPEPSFVDQSPSSEYLRQGDDSSPSASSRVLLKKKRAVPASFKNIIETLSLCGVKLFECAPLSDVAKISTSIPDDLPVCPHGFQLCHSGISPPSV